MDAELAAGVGPRPRCPARAPHGRAARREQPLGVRRPAVLGRRGRLLHQRLDRRQRCVARRRHRRHRRLVPRASTARRRLELRVGRGLDPIVVPLDAQLAQGTACLRRRDRRHRRDARRPARRRGIPACSAGSFAACRRANPWRRGWTDSPTPSAGPTTCSTRRSTSATASLLDGVAPDPRMADAIEHHPRRQTAGRHLAAGPAPSRTGVVRGRRCRPANRRSG